MGCVAGLVGSIHINSTVFFFFSYFHLSSDHISIFHILIFAYSQIFKNAAHINSIHSVRKMFHRTEVGLKQARDF
jgi:hypothetical protein